MMTALSGILSFEEKSIAYNSTLMYPYKALKGTRFDVCRSFEIFS